MTTLLSSQATQDASGSAGARSTRRKGRGRRFDTPQAVLAGALIGSLALYLVGITFALVVVCVGVGVCLLPSLAVMRSLIGRLFFSSVLFVGLFQVAATIQFLVLPSTRFGLAAGLTVAFYLVAVLVADVTVPGIRGRVVGFCDRHDAAGAIIAAIFLVPFIPVLIGDDTVARVAQIGGLQAVDATNHFSMIATMMEHQHLSYEKGHYYPQGFHITTAFLQDSLGIRQTSMSWHQTVFVYIGQYLVLGVLMAAAIGYFLSAAVAAFDRHSSTGRRDYLLPAASVAVGAMAGPFLLWPFVQQGFLSTFYVIATILVASTVLLAGARERLFTSVSLYLLLVFGAGLSWPLLVPPLLATLALVLCQKGNLGLLRRMPRRRLLAMAVLVAVQFVPIVFQVLYSASDGQETVNLAGALRTFHPLSLLLGALLLVAVATSRIMDRDAKDKGIALLLPILTFVGLLAVAQFFLLGEVRYYVIKTAFLLETLNMVFLSCLVAIALSRVDLGAIGKFFTAAVVPAVVVLSLFAVTANPLNDLRNLFRTEAGADKPAGFDADLAAYVALAEAGRIDGFNSMLLHYDAEKKTYFAHMQIEFWVNMLQYDATPADFEASACNASVYRNLTFGEFTEVEQHAAVVVLKRCAQFTEDRGGEFIILTDAGSEDAIRKEFGGVATVVAH